MKEQKIVVTGFLRKGDTVLLVKRSDDDKSLPGYFEMPGGKVDFGESTEMALAREYVEEVGLNIQIQHMYNAFTYMSKDGTRHTVQINYIVKSDSTKITLSHEHVDFKWATIEEIDSLLMTKNIKKAVKKAFAKYKE